MSGAAAVSGATTDKSGPGKSGPGKSGPGKSAAGKSARDVRLDLFRGFALIFIFLDHMPSNTLNWLTLEHYGFSDAAEVFIFISGYAAALAYGRGMERSGFLFGAARIWRRVWQLYVAHIVVFVIFLAEVSYLDHHFQNPMFVEEMGATAFVETPDVALVQALLLKFKPQYLDILPLYIVLLLCFPPVLPALRRAPGAVLTASFLLYALTRPLDLHLSAYPDEERWFFNPFAWQFLFVIGAHCALHRLSWPWRPRVVSVLRSLALAYIAGAFVLTLSWSVPRLAGAIPTWIAQLLYPIDKTSLDPLRLAHFLALAYLMTLTVRSDARFLAWAALRPVIRCGQQSLQVFCLGIFLSFAGQFAILTFGGALAAQIGVGVGGVALMIGLAYLITWFRDSETALSRGSSPRAATASADGGS